MNKTELKEIVADLKRVEAKLEAFLEPKERPDPLMTKRRFQHFHDVNGKFRGTVCTEPTSDGTGLKVSGAVVSKKEKSASRKQGREIAVRRMIAGDYFFMSVEEYKEEVTTGTILANFPGGSRIKLPKKPF